MQANLIQFNFVHRLTLKYVQFNAPPACENNQYSVIRVKAKKNG